jgi:hypothetical protein
MKNIMNADLLVPLIVVIQLVQELFVQLNAFPDVSVRKDILEALTKNVSNLMIVQKSIARILMKNIVIALIHVHLVLNVLHPAYQVVFAKKDLLKMTTKSA